MNLQHEGSCPKSFGTSGTCRCEVAENTRTEMAMHLMCALVIQYGVLGAAKVAVNCADTLIEELAKERS